MKQKTVNKTSNVVSSNDIKVDTAEVGQNWDIYTDTTKLEGKVDKHIYRNVGKTDELAIMDEYENPYSTILVSTDSSEANEGFVKELKPIVKNGTIDDDSKATISLTTSKVFAGTDEGRTGMDNFIEILTLDILQYSLPIFGGVSKKLMINFLINDKYIVFFSNILLVINITFYFSFQNDY